MVGFFLCEATLKRKQYRETFASWGSPLSPQKREHAFIIVTFYVVTEKALVGWLSWLERLPYTKRLQVQYPVRAHASVAGSIRGWSAYRRQRIDVSLTH